MSVTPEQVKKLSAALGVDEIAALSALERCGGDPLEAALELERQGSVPPPIGGGFYSTQPAGNPSAGSRSGGASSGGGRGQGRSWWRVEYVTKEEVFSELKNLLRRSLVNRLEIRRQGRTVAGVPLLVLLLLLVFFFWIIALVLGLGLLLGFRYRFCGPDMDRESVDRAVKKATDAVSEAVGKVKTEIHKSKRKP